MLRAILRFRLAAGEDRSHTDPRRSTFRLPFRDTHHAVAPVVRQRDERFPERWIPVIRQVVIQRYPQMVCPSSSSMIESRSPQSRHRYSPVPSFIKSVWLQSFPSNGSYSRSSPSLSPFNGFTIPLAYTPCPIPPAISCFQSLGSFLQRNRVELVLTLPLLWIAAVSKTFFGVSYLLENNRAYCKLLDARRISFHASVWRSFTALKQ